MNSPEMPSSTPYDRPNLLEQIYQRLESVGIKLEKLTRKDLSFVDEFHLQGAAVTRALCQSAQLSQGMEVLDIGCGIGGACRMMAAEFGCSPTGIDYTAEYIRVAQALTKKVGLATQIKFLHANALNLPFEENSFDCVWTQHAQMNIQDKSSLYGEVNRVLKQGGKFLYYDIFGTETEIQFPVPWAAEASQSHLMQHGDWPQFTEAFNWKREYHRAFTLDAKQFLAGAVKGIQQGKGPKVGLDLLLGDSTLIRFENLLKGLQEANLEVHAGVFRKV